MKEPLAFALVTASVSVYSALWTCAPVSRLLSKNLPNPDNDLTWDYVYDFFVDQTVPRAAILVFLIASTLVAREFRKKLAWAMTALIFPLIWIIDLIWVAIL